MICCTLLSIDIVEEQLFAQFNKIANSILCSKSKEEPNTVECSLGSENVKQTSEKECEVKENCSSPDIFSRENSSPLMKIKALQVGEQSP